jgi:uncharacterized protein YjbI with pentapeptide repeats
MPRPARAPVKPRILSGVTGAALLLEDEVQSLLDRQAPALVQLAAEMGSGKTQALAHLAAVFAGESRLRLIDENEAWPPHEAGGTDVIIFVGQSPRIRQPAQKRLLAPWHRDELIEYLLVRHPQRIASVMARISNSEIQEFRGNPELLRLIADELALDEACPDAIEALMRNLRERIVSDELWDSLGEACLGEYGYARSGLEDVVRLLGHPPVRQLMAAEYLVSQLTREGRKTQIPTEMSRALVHAVARRIESNPIARSQLEFAMEAAGEEPMAASLLHAIDPAWQPSNGEWLNLAGAHLNGVSWAGIQLSKARLTRADLSHAELTLGVLDEATAERANFSGALLTRASLVELNGFKVDLSGANLTGAKALGAQFWAATLCEANLDDAHLGRASFFESDLSGASFRGAALNGADFKCAEIEGTDFSGADLSRAIFSYLVLRKACFDGARFTSAVLERADLEGMQLDGLDFSGANLSEALLTGTSMRGADLSDCDLSGAGLADVDWEDACLCRADLRGATFHLGSSRSGLVGSPIASEGTRTGFYTDDFTEQDFKPPEEIRKANLRNADLSGANVEGVDFYLVDLRGAKYDADQAEHFRRCGAILEDRCPQ